MRYFLTTVLLVSAPAVFGQTSDDLAFLEKAYAARTAPDAADWKNQVEAKFGQFKASFDALLANNRGEEAVRFAVPFAYFLSSANQQKQALDVLTRALSAPGAQAATSDREHALYNAGLLAFRQGDESKSRQLNEESLNVARKVSDPAGEAAALIGLSRIALRHHEYKTVIADAEKAAELRRGIGDERGSIGAMHMVAAAERMQGNDERAQHIYESTLENFRTAGNESGAIGELYNLGYVHLHQKHLAKAEDLFGDALKAYASSKDDASVAYCLAAFGAVAAVKKDGVRAAHLYGAAAATLDRLGIKLDPDDQLDWDRYTALARRELNGKFESEFQRGRTLTLEEAIALAK